MSYMSCEIPNVVVYDNNGFLSVRETPNGGKYIDL